MEGKGCVWHVRHMGGEGETGVCETCVRLAFPRSYGKCERLVCERETCVCERDLCVRETCVRLAFPRSISGAA